MQTVLEFYGASSEMEYIFSLEWTFIIKGYFDIMQDNFSADKTWAYFYYLTDF